ncbi:SAM-dependent methyltransferase [Streptomyces sp. JNUCC 64]
MYGPRGFYRRPEGPAGHFRTSVHASPLFAGAVARLLCRVDGELGRPAELAFVDLGAGRGELVAGVLAALPPEVAARTRAVAVERADRPTGPGAPAHRIEWRAEPPTGVRGLLFANEWLDNVPLDIAETDADGVLRQVLVTPDGTESLGAPLREAAAADADWADRWWPLPAAGDDGTDGYGDGDQYGYGYGYGYDGTDRDGVTDDGPTDNAHRNRNGDGDGDGYGNTTLDGRADRPAPGLRVEIGRTRDAAWAAAVATLSAGLAVAVDYAHDRAARPPYGTLTGFRAGREVPPVPDGSGDVTAHVALDSCALPGAETASQRAALRALGVSGERPPLALASRDPAGYVRALARAGEAAELTAPEGLGGFGWLLQPVGLAPGVLDRVRVP